MEKNLEYKLNLTLDLFRNIINSSSCQDLISELKSKSNLSFIFSGVGKNWYICEKEEKTFISMGINTKALDCTHALHGDLGMLMNPNEEKYIFFVSKSGKTEEMHKLIDVIIDLKNKEIIKNIHLIMVCLYPNVLEIYKDKFDYILVPDKSYENVSNIELDNRNLIPTLSISITQLVLDYIGVSVYENDQKLIENYKYNHMGGHNGSILKMDKYLKEI